MAAHAGKEDRVTVGGRRGGELRAECTGGTGPVVDRHLLTERDRHLLTDEARDGVVAAARRKRHDETDGLRRILRAVFGAVRRRAQQKWHGNAAGQQRAGDTDT